ncbi:unnamed protein product [Pleuronectes platessa]|uniref:Uncharacterized protein n=1 Tax=Pleuronectes platessa TaxID=8262 RepID=A0A9N7V475_PLEPL|nr:unnamed protein product [Pleuronectes platessa]
MEQDNVWKLPRERVDVLMRKPKVVVCLCPQVYTASNPNGTTTGKTFKVHLQLWDTAGQERWDLDLDFRHP